jgi:hypothetical protein
MAEQAKYQREARHLLSKLDAEAVVVIVMNGVDGHGVACVERTSDVRFRVSGSRMQRTLPGILRKMADKLEELGLYGSAGTLD